MQVLPSFRPDQALDVRNPGYAAYLQRLGQAAGFAIVDLETLKAALENRLTFLTSWAAACPTMPLPTCPMPRQM